MILVGSQMLDINNGQSRKKKGLELLKKYCSTYWYFIHISIMFMIEETIFYTQPSTKVMVQVEDVLVTILESDIG